MPHPLTEKTLELNIMAELAYLGRLAGYQPYFIGFSQLEEMFLGSDTYFSAGALIGFFQFKRGYQRSSFFTFYINNNQPHFNQHHILSNTNIITNACRYIFPLIGSNEEVYKRRGYLLYWSVPFPPQSFNPLAPPNERHRVRLYNNGTWERYSEVKIGTWRNIFGELPAEEYFRERLPEQEQLQPEQVFKNLNLPTIETTLTKLDSREVQEVFKQRSSFCMIFDR